MTDHPNLMWHARRPVLWHARCRQSMDLQALHEMANRSTRARRRAEAMGWTFAEARVWFEPPETVVTQGLFTCRCGRTEAYRLAFSFDSLGLGVAVIDPAEELQRMGSFSAEHLRKDGYSEDEIKAALHAGYVFDLREAGYAEASEPSA